MFRALVAASLLLLPRAALAAQPIPDPADAVVGALEAWPKFRAERFKLVREDLKNLRRNEQPLSSATATFSSHELRLFVLQIGWSWVVVAIDEDDEVTDALAIGSKSGYSVIWRSFESELLLVGHEHPGTDMHYALPYRVRVEKNGKLVATELSDAEFAKLAAAHADAAR